MKIEPILFTLVLIVSTFFSCSKSASPPRNNPGTDTTSTPVKDSGIVSLTGPANAIKRFTSIDYQDNSSSVLDSTIETYGYDNQNRISTVETHTWDNSSGTPVITDSTTTVTYSVTGNTTMALYFKKGSAAAYNRHIYYLSPNSLLDSDVVQDFLNGSWNNNMKETYTYDNSGQAIRRLFFQGNSTSGTWNLTLQDFYIWSNGDPVYDSTIAIDGSYLLEKTIYNQNLNPFVSNDNTSGEPYAKFDFKGIGPQHLISKKTDTDYSVDGTELAPPESENWTYSMDSKNRVASLSQEAEGQSIPSFKNLIEYY